jgi:RNA polymerase sigma factor (sigma-70 family)
MSNRDDQIHPTTTTFIEGLKDRNPAALNRFKKYHLPVVFKLCLDGCNDRDAAESVTEEVIRVVLARIQSFDRSKGFFRNYVKRITFSKISDCNRKQKALINKLERQNFMEQYDQLLLRRVISDLKRQTGITEQSWEMFFLHYRDKTAITEIALKFGITVDSVKRTLRRIRKQIEKELDE